MARGKAHSDETRAAVMAALLAGQGVSEVAERYELNSSTVKNWKRQLNPVQPEKMGVDFGGLLAQYLEEALATAAEHQRMARSSEWFNRQPASEIGTFGGIHLDKVVRLLDAAQRAAESSELAEAEDAGADAPPVADPR